MPRIDDHIPSAGSWRDANVDRIIKSACKLFLNLSIMNNHIIVGHIIDRDQMCCVQSLGYAILLKRIITMTIHDTMIARTVMRRIALLFFKLAGWKSQGRKPDISRYVIIAAPHTSNWDFIYTLCLTFIYRIKPVIMMKDAWFRWPLGPLFRWLGVIPIDQSKSNNVVAQSIAHFNQSKNMILVLAPAGTRKRARQWRTGFYYIATGAGVPIVLGFLDYRRKIGGIGPTIHPTGDLEADMTVIQSFYKDIAGKHPENSRHEST